MNQTIESQATTSTKSRRLETIVIWCVIVALGLITVGPFARYYDVGNGWFLTPFPWVVASGMTIAHGLQMSSGVIPDMPSIATRCSCLASILMLVVIAPTLFLFGLKARAAERASGKELRILRWSSLQFVLGGMVILLPSIVALPIALIQQSVSSSLRAAVAETQNKDAILYELNTVAWKLYEYQALRKEYGGGSGSFAGFTLPKDLASTSEAQYKVELQDTLATVMATSARYPQGNITATIGKHGKFIGWKYSELFE